MKAKQYKTYPKYKDSGIEWLHQIPEQWEVKKLAYCLNYFVGFTPETKENTFYGEGHNWATISDLDGKYISKTKHQITERAVKYYSKPKVKKGSLLYSFKLSVGQVAYAVEDIYTNEAIASFPPSSGFSLGYLYYLSPISILQNAAENIYGAKILNQELINNSKLIVPPLLEQEKIAKFLDAKVGHIDRLVSKLEEQLKLIDEQRNSLITVTVCKGLNPKAPMKDSGIQWLGKIPTHWKLKKIKHNTYVKGRIGWQGLKSDDFKDEGCFLVTGTDFINGQINWSSCYFVDENRYNMDEFIQLKENDLLITKDGTIGKIAIVKNMPYKATLNSGIFVVRPTDGSYVTSFLYHILNSNIFKSFIRHNSYGSTIAHLYQNVFVDFSYPLPPLQEQEEIVAYLDEKLTKIDALKSKTIEQIELLKEYKTSLITNVVTGKIDVRNEVI